jgi:hypothetical protein
MIQMGWGGFGLHHQTWECQDDGVGRCGGRRIPLWRLKRIGNWLAVHMRVQHPRCIRSGVTVDGRRHSTHGQPEIYNLISRKSAQVVVGRCNGIHISQSGSWVTGGGSNARATGEVLTVEQSSNNDTDRRCGKHYSRPCRIKKATARGPLQGATDGCTRAIHGASRDPGN